MQNPQKQDLTANMPETSLFLCVTTNPPLFSKRVTSILTRITNILITFLLFFVVLLLKHAYGNRMDYFARSLNFRNRIMHVFLVYGLFCPTRCIQHSFM